MVGLRQGGWWLAGLLLGAAPALAWTPRTQLAIALDAARLAPRDLQGQLHRHYDQYEEGVLAPFRQAPAIRHYKDADGEGELDQAVFEATARAIADLRRPLSFADIVRQLGVVCHFVADLDNPLNCSGTDRAEGRYYADYLRYAEGAQSRFTRVFYAGGPPVNTESDLRRLVASALFRGRELYPLVGREYRRIGFASGVGRFDDRSTAFGVAAVGYSRALSDIARVLRYIWLQAGGADDREVFRSRERRLLVLPRAVASR